MTRARQILGLHELMFFWLLNVSFIQIENIYYKEGNENHLKSFNPHHILIYFLPVIFFQCLCKTQITLMSRPFGWEGRCCVQSGFGSLERGWNLAVGSPSWGSCHAWGYIHHSRPPIFLENKIVLFCPAHLGPDSGSDKTEAAKEWKHQKLGSF